MAYKKRDIRDRVASQDDIFKREDLPGGRFRLIPDPGPGSITAEGTDINRVLMQPWEDVHAAVSGSDEVQLKMMHNGRVVRIRHRGNYSNTINYDEYDYVVSAQGSGFIAKADNTAGTAPPVTAVESARWKPFKW
ncbi:MAG: hypothetical protein FWE14_09300 [Lachnospiraceae bacterium]|nr:hypothetical protein [Lachnospiraceae bacterium]